MTADKRDGRQGDKGRGASRNGAPRQGNDRGGERNGRKGGASDPHAARESERYDSPIASREHILATLAETKGPVDLERLGEILGTDADEDATEALRRRVMAMQRDGQLVLNRKHGLVPVDDDSLVRGRISAHKDGFGFIVTEDDAPDVFLNARQMRRVLHGDRVVASISGTDRRGRREGRIVDVVERANETLVGRLAIEHGVAFLSPDNRKIHQDLMLGPDGLGGAKHGDMVVGEILEQPTDRQPPMGRIVEILGEHLDAGMEIDVALRSAGIPDEWPDDVVAQAEAIPAEVPENAKVGRKDLRSVPLVTIDGVDARDFDDAVWCERSGKGWRLIVAIADVAHYVQPDSPLDREAVNRGTSVYFPGRVVPMLPESLSNGLCSINPDVDRLCMFCDMIVDERGTPRRTRFHNGVMRSHARFTYDRVAEILDDPSTATKDQASLVPMLQDLHSLYGARARARKRRGAIEFESNETHIVFDENRKIEKLVPIERNDAHKLIEECMILANIAAATLLERFETPALYRVHPRPKADKLEDLRAFLALRGLSLGGGESPSALDYAALASDISDRTDRHVIQTVMLRSMQQAVYTPNNEGHFGLALEEYAHFTSPIRRYPDLLVHRGIKHLIARGTPATYRYSMADMKALGERCSMTERRAEEASRDVVSWLKCEYMLEHVGDEFAGTVASVTSFGLFVELDDSHVEGLIHITNLAHDYYRFEQAAHRLVGDRTGRIYRLGDAMVVKVAAVNLDERKIDFQEVRHAPSAHGEAGATDEAADERRADKRRDRKQGKREAERLAGEVMAAQPAPASQDGQGAPDPSGQAVRPVPDEASGESPGEHGDRPRKRKKKKRKRSGKRPDGGAGEASGVVAGHSSDGQDGSAVTDLPPEDVSAAHVPASDRPETTRDPEPVSDGGSDAGTGTEPGMPATSAEPAVDRSDAGGRRPAPADPAPAPANESPEEQRPRPSPRYEVGRRAPPQRVRGKEEPAAAPDTTPSDVPAPTDTSVDASARRAAPGTDESDAEPAPAAAKKRSAAKKASAKKAAGRKVVAKKAATKKVTAKKATAKKATAKKATAKKATAKKAAAKKAAAKKAAAKKVTTKKAVGKVAKKRAATGKGAAAGDTGPDADA